MEIRKGFQMASIGEGSKIHIFPDRAYYSLCSKGGDTHTAWGDDANICKACKRIYEKQNK